MCWVFSLRESQNIYRLHISNLSCEPAHFCMGGKSLVSWVYMYIYCPAGMCNQLFNIWITYGIISMHSTVMVDGLVCTALWRMSLHTAKCPLLSLQTRLLGPSRHQQVVNNQDGAILCFLTHWKTLSKDLPYKQQRHSLLPQTQTQLVPTLCSSLHIPYSMPLQMHNPSLTLWPLTSLFHTYVMWRSVHPGWLLSRF